MAQAVALQSEILAKDLTSIDALWVDAHRSQERYQASYSARLNELIEASKRKQSQQQQLANASSVGATAAAAASTSRVATAHDGSPSKNKESIDGQKKKKDHHKSINEG